MRLMREALPSDGESAFPRRFDLLIVDEAHNIAPPGPRQLRGRLAAHAGDPHAGSPFRAQAVPERDAAQRLQRELPGPARAARRPALPPQLQAERGAAGRGDDPPPEARAAAGRFGQRALPGAQARGARGAVHRRRAPRARRARALHEAARGALRGRGRRGEGRLRVRHQAAQEADVLLPRGAAHHPRQAPREPPQASRPPALASVTPPGILRREVDGYEQESGVRRGGGAQPRKSWSTRARTRVPRSARRRRRCSTACCSVRRARLGRADTKAEALHATSSRRRCAPRRHLGRHAGDPLHRVPRHAELAARACSPPSGLTQHERHAHPLWRPRHRASARR
jgi:hypothetical protein